MELTEKRTGWVKVLLVSGQVRIVQAESFGAAAAQINAGNGSIVRFEWAAPPTPGA